MDGLDLGNVMERAQGQDAEALGEIYRHYVRRVFGLRRRAFLGAGCCSGDANFIIEQDSRTGFFCGSKFQRGSRRQVDAESESTGARILSDQPKPAISHHLKTGQQVWEACRGMNQADEECESESLRQGFSISGSDPGSRQALPDRSLQLRRQIYFTYNNLTGRRILRLSNGIVKLSKDKLREQAVENNSISCHGEYFAM
jgi:hypothetical protein